MIFNRLDFKVSAILVVAMLLSSGYAIWLYSKQSLIFSKLIEAPQLAELQQVNDEFTSLSASSSEQLLEDFTALADNMVDKSSTLYSILVDAEYNLVASTLPRQHYVELVRPELVQDKYVVTISSRLEKAEILMIYHELPSRKVVVSDVSYTLITLPVSNKIPAGFDRSSVWWQFLLHAEKFSLLFIVLVVLAIVVVFRSFKPLRNLEKVAQQLADNEIPQQIPNADNSEVGKLISAFNHASDRIQEFQQQREQMTSDIAHELRTPITNMLGRIEAYEENIIQDERAVISFVSTQLKGLTNIVEDMQLLSLADSKELVVNTHSIDLEQLIKNWCSQYEVEHNVAFALSLISLDWELDEARFCQVLDNLLSNSKKARAAGLEVFISVALELNQQTLTVTFEDNGPGVPPQHLDKLFDRLYRADPSRAAATGGSGLGLSIVKTLIEAQRGTVKAFASPKGGLGIKMSFSAKSV